MDPVLLEDPGSDFTALLLIEPVGHRASRCVHTELMFTPSRLCFKNQNPKPTFRSLLPSMRHIAHWVEDVGK